MGEIKGFLIATGAAIVSFFMPIGDFIVAMILLFAVNFGFGLLADIVNGGGWQTKKAMQFFVQCFVFFVLAFCIFSIGEKMHAHDEAITGVKYLCTVALWFFSVNIARNWMNITPNESVFHKIAYFAYYVLSAQFVERIPFLKRFIQEKEQEKEQDEAVAQQRHTQPKPQNGFAPDRQPKPQNGFAPDRQPKPQNGFAPDRQPKPQNGFAPNGHDRSRRTASHQTERT